MFSQINNIFISNNDQNVVELFKPVYTLLSLTGLFPYSIRFPKGKSDCKITRGSLLFHSLCGVVVVAYYCLYFTIFLKHNFVHIANTPADALTDTNFIIELLVLLISTITSYLCAIRYRKVYVRILSRIAFLWSDLSNAPNFDVAPILMYLRKILFIPVIFGLLVFLPQQIVMIVIGESLTLWELLTVLSETVPSLVVAFYSALVLMVAAILKNITSLCQNNYLSYYRNSDVNTVSASIKKDNNRIALIHLESAYVKAIEVKQEINEVFQAPIAIIILQCFYTIICEAYSLYHEMVITRNFEMFYVMDRGYWTIYSLAKMVVLTSTGSLLKAEVAQIGLALHCIPIPNPQQNLNLFMQIQHFSTLLSFHGAEVTIYGFFSLDLNLLFNMVASLVTYLIIMVQFDTA